MKAGLRLTSLAWGVMCALFALAILYTALFCSAQEPSPQESKYLTDMRSAAKQAYEFSIMNDQNGDRSKRSLEPIYDWSRHRLDTDLQIALSKAERRTAALAHQARMTREREIAHVLWKYGERGGEAHIEAATTYFLAQANRWVLDQTEGEPENERSAADLAELKSMRAAARDAVQAVQASYDAGSSPLEEIYLWSKRSMQAESEGATPDEAKKLCAEHFKRMQQLHILIQAKHDRGFPGGETNPLNASKFYLAEAEFLQARLRNPDSKDAQATLAAAGDTFQSFAELYRSGKGDLGQTCIWSQRWLTASLNSATPASTAYSEERDRIKDLHDQVGAKRPAGAPARSPGDVVIAQFYLNDADLQIAKHAN